MRNHVPFGEEVMAGIIAVYGRKLFSLTLIFNALLTIAYAIGLLTGLYVGHWTLYAPFLIDGNLIWLAIMASIMNIFPSAVYGKVKTGRLWFHHYVYGFFVSGASAVLIILFTSVSLITLFTSNITDLSLNLGRFFILGGMVLVLDDLPDVSRVTAWALGWLKVKAYQVRRAIHVVQCINGAMCLYFSVTISLWMALNTSEITVANIILAGTLLVTSATSFMSVRHKIWLKMSPKKEAARVIA